MQRDLSALLLFKDLAVYRVCFLTTSKEKTAGAQKTSLNYFTTQ
jgi:hypothetical protein